jgi:hypothetical protein
MITPIRVHVGVFSIFDTAIRGERETPREACAASNRCPQVWSWDITKLLGPAEWTDYLYVIMNTFSRPTLAQVAVSAEYSVLQAK